MKKSVFSVLLIAALFCSVFTLGCKGEETPEHTNPSFLEGNWTSTPAGKSFVIASDYTFTCQFQVPTLQEPPAPATLPAEVSGKLNYTNKKLGPNDYLLTDMALTNNQQAIMNWEDGNPAGGVKSSALTTAINGYNGTLIVTLTPNKAKTSFTLTSTGKPEAEGFFGGKDSPFTKQ